MELQSEADVTTNVGEDSERLPSRTPMDWTPPLVKTQLGEPDFKTVKKYGPWSEFTFRLGFAKGGGIYKIHALPTGVMPLAQDSSGTRQFNEC